MRFGVRLDGQVVPVSRASSPSHPRAPAERLDRVSSPRRQARRNARGQTDSRLSAAARGGPRGHSLSGGLDPSRLESRWGRLSGSSESRKRYSERSPGGIRDYTYETAADVLVICPVSTQLARRSSRARVHQTRLIGDDDRLYTGARVEFG